MKVISYWLVFRQILPFGQLGTWRVERTASFWPLCMDISILQSWPKGFVLLCAQQSCEGGQSFPGGLFSILQSH